MSFKSLKSARTLTCHIGSAAFAAAICVAAVSSSSQAETPDYFLEWVESKSNLYVDTGIRGRCGTKAEVRFANLGGDTHHAMLAAAKITNGTWAHLGFCTMWGQSMRFWYAAKYDSSWPAAARVGTIDHPATQYGRIHYAQRGGMGDGTWKYIGLIDYTFMGEGDTSKLNGAGGSWQDNNLKFSQLRFDG